jgi:hypothetical protein
MIVTDTVTVRMRRRRRARRASFSAQKVLEFVEQQRELLFLPGPQMAVARTVPDR